MSTLTLQIELPDNFELSEHDAKMTLAAKLYGDGKLTAGKAAAIVGITKRRFIETIGQYGVPIFQATREEAEKDYQANAKSAVQDFLNFCTELNMPPMTDEEIDQAKYDYLMGKYQ